MIPKLTVRNQDSFFGVRVRHLEYFTYTAAFLYNDVLAFADKAGYHIEYCDHTTIQYRTWGDRTCRALKRGEAWEVEVKQERPEAGLEHEETAHGPITLPEQFEDFRTKIADLVLQFEAKKNEAADIRDKLRDIADEIKDIVESFDDGVEGMDDAIEQFKHAIDDMSRYV